MDLMILLLRFVAADSLVVTINCFISVLFFMCGYVMVWRQSNEGTTKSFNTNLASMC